MKRAKEMSINQTNFLMIIHKLSITQWGSRFAVWLTTLLKNLLTQEPIL
jgi:hypothetical protein